MSSARIVMPALVGMLALGVDAPAAPEPRTERPAKASRGRRAPRTRRSSVMNELFPLPWLVVVGAPEPAAASPSPFAAKK